MAKTIKAAPKFEDDVIEDLMKRTEAGVPLTTICADPRMPSVRSVYAWNETDTEFAARFHAARARGVHALAEECLVIADKPAADAVEVADKRVRIDTRLRLAGKWLPKVYGDKTLLGSDPDNPLPAGFTVNLVRGREKVE